MAQGQFTKEEAEATREAVIEMFEAIAKSRRMAYIVHLNDVLIFLRVAGEAAPTEVVKQSIGGTG